MTPVLPNRVRLSAPLTLYVSTSGTESGPGTVGAPFATAAQAYAYLCQNYDTASFPVTIQLADGTYTATSVSGLIIGSATPSDITIIGNPSSPANVQLGNSIGGSAFTAFNGARVSINGVKFYSPDRSCMEAAGFGTAIAIVGPVEFSSCPNFHINATVGAYISASADYTVSGDATFHYSASVMGMVDMETGITVTIGARTFNAFAIARYGATIDHKRATFVGSAIGYRYRSESFSSIHTDYGGPDYFPGDTPGFTDNGHYD